MAPLLPAPKDIERGNNLPCVLSPKARRLFGIRNDVRVRLMSGLPAPRLYGLHPAQDASIIAGLIPIFMLCGCRIPATALASDPGTVAHRDLQAAAGEMRMLGIQMYALCYRTSTARTPMASTRSTPYAIPGRASSSAYSPCARRSTEIPLPEFLRPRGTPIPPGP